MFMHPEAVASLPIWLAGLLMVGLAVCGAVVVEMVARRVVPLEVRRDNAVVASAMFAVIGTTYAVLLAFVAMLAWDGYNKAEAVANNEAALLQDVYHLIGGVLPPNDEPLRADVTAYARAVIETEWPAQKRGRDIPEEEPHLLHMTTVVMHLRSDAFLGSEVHSLLLEHIIHLDTARRERLLAAHDTMPDIIWFVLVAGGGITVAFGSFFGASSLRLHLAMSSLLAVSGALVLLVIVSLSNPFRGDLGVPITPFEHVMADMPPG